MSGKPTSAAKRAATWLRAGKGTAADAARRFKLSSSQARRIAAQVGMAPAPVGRPREIAP